MAPMQTMINRCMIGGMWGNGLGVEDSATLAAEVGGALALEGLMLVFLPVFLDRLRSNKEALSAKWITISRFIIWLAAALVIVPAAAATLGLVTLWDQANYARATAALTMISIWLVVGYTILTVWMADTVWKG